MNDHHNQVQVDNPRNIQKLKGQSRVFAIPSHSHQQSFQSIYKNIQVYETLSPTPPKVISQLQEQNPALFTCRICLQQSPCLHAQNQDQLKEECSLPQSKYVIRTCKCQGTSGYVHQRCILKWIEEQTKRTKQNQMRCQICLQEIFYEKKTIDYFQFTIKKCQSLSPCSILCLASMILVLTGCITLITQSQQLEMTDFVKITIIILIGLLIGALFLSVVVIVKENFYRKKIEMGRVFTNDEIEVTGFKRDKFMHQERTPSIHIRQLRVETIRSIRTIHSGRDELIVQNRQRTIRQGQISNNNWQLESQLSSPYQFNQTQPMTHSVRATPLRIIPVQIRSGGQIFQ